MVYPVVLGEGKRLFAGGTSPAAFSLSSSTTTSAGVLVLTYQRAGEVQAGTFALDDATAQTG